MRFYSHEWAASDDEAECRQVADQYAQMLDGYPLPARGPVTRFVESFDLRGAILDGLSIDRRSRTVTADIFAGDRQSGYKLLKIVYQEASVTSADRRIFESVLEAKGPQIRYDEFDLGSEGGQPLGCRHRFLFWPREYGEGAIEFSDLSWTLQPAQERQRAAEGGH